MAKVRVNKTKGAILNVGKRLGQRREEQGTAPSLQSLLASNSLHAACTDDQMKEVQKEVKRKYKEMKQMTGTSFQKFLSVYRFKTTLSNEEKIKLL